MIDVTCPFFVSSMYPIWPMDTLPVLTYYVGSLGLKGIRTLLGLVLWKMITTFLFYPTMYSSLVAYQYGQSQYPYP